MAAVDADGHVWKQNFQGGKTNVQITNNKVVQGSGKGSLRGTVTMETR